MKFGRWTAAVAVTTLWGALWLTPRPAQAAGERVQVIVMDLTTRGGIDKDTADTLTALIATELSKYAHLEVTSGEDIRKMMDLEAVKAKAGCEDDTSCVAEIAGALGAPYAVYGTVSKLGPYKLLQVSLFDVHEAKNLSREAVRVKEVYELLDRLPGTLATLTTPVRTTFGAVPTHVPTPSSRAVVEVPKDDAPPDDADKKVATRTPPAPPPDDSVGPPAEDTPPGERLQVLALDLEASGVDTNQVKTLDALVVQALSRHGKLQVLSTADIEQMLDLEAEKAAMGCDTNSCLAEIAGAMGAQYVVYGSVGQLDELTVVQLNLFDSEMGQSANREKIERESISSVGRRVDGAVHRLVSGLLPEAERWDESMRLPDDDIRAPAATSSGPPLLALGVAGGGGLLALGGVVLAGVGAIPLLTYQGARSDLASATEANDVAAAADAHDGIAESQAQWSGPLGMPTLLAGGAVMAAGVAGVVGGAVWAATGDGEEAE